MALNHALNNHRLDVVIHTDCMSLIHAICQVEPRDSVFLLTSILLLLQQIRDQGRRVIVNWVPSHIGIPVNEAADRAARAAATGPSAAPLPVFPSRAELEQSTKKTMLRRALRRHRTLANESHSAKWYQVVTAYEPLRLSRWLSRGDENRLFRLRLGYKCRWEVLPRIQPEESSCPHCNEVEVTNLLHYITECPATAFLRAGPATTPEGFVRRFLMTTNTHRISQLARFPPPK